MFCFVSEVKADEGIGQQITALRKVPGFYFDYFMKQLETAASVTRYIL